MPQAAPQGLNTSQVEGVDSQVDGVDSQVDGVDSQVDGVDSQVDGVDSQVDDVHHSPYPVFACYKLHCLEFGL